MVRCPALEFVLLNATSLLLQGLCQLQPECSSVVGDSRRSDRVASGVVAIPHRVTPSHSNRLLQAFNWRCRLSSIGFSVPDTGPAFDYRSISCQDITSSDREYIWLQIM
ncbi:hypothetical protein BGZ61DRAFT_60570 [Ilyonectria robusta]|uniref:uncharacterized protein n=1 Tax=Ilyonectria robusta TaxID=1079257 RepID=UPI001E8CFF27|nr:uncharacterized protein BGZ61DRAFT_60570 [Ilyonectria robusta]KAH8684178.1 hypothetical protein BGZ61DRAFT_60570 [Ilyonectria robusta]